jgi:hypothetical protein
MKPLKQSSTSPLDPAKGNALLKRLFRDQASADRAGAGPDGAQRAEPAADAADGLLNQSKNGSTRQATSAAEAAVHALRKSIADGAPAL